MGPRLIQPGAFATLRHPKTGMVIEPLYMRKNGTAVWPVIGAASDDPDDPAYGEGESGGGGRSLEDDDTDDDEDEEEEKPKPRSKPKADEDDDDDDSPALAKASRQAKRYRLALRAEEQKNAELAARLTALENKDKPADEVASAELSSTRETVTKLTAQNRELVSQLSFFSVQTGIEWADASDAFALAQREGLFEDAVDEDGNVDKRELRRGLRDLAKRKPHLVKTDSKSEDSKDEDKEEEEPRSPRPMNGTRRGKKDSTPTRAELAKKFPILNRH